MHRINLSLVIEGVSQTKQVRHFPSKKINQNEVVFELPNQTPLLIVQNLQLIQVVAQ
jgi:hypothetical protein